MWRKPRSPKIPPRCSRVAPRESKASNSARSGFGVCAPEGAAYVRAYEVHAHEVYPCEMHACEVHAHEVHAHKMHPREVHAHETPAHHCFGRSLAQTVVDLSRSKFENQSFCASCGVVPMTRRSRRTGCDKVARLGRTQPALKLRQHHVAQQLGWSFTLM
jgi:hypothetical protein